MWRRGLNVVRVDKSLCDAPDGGWKKLLHIRIFNSVSHISSSCGVNVVYFLIWLWIISQASQQFTFLHFHYKNRFHRLIKQPVLTRHSRMRTSGTTNYFNGVLFPASVTAYKAIIKLLLITPSFTNYNCYWKKVW